MDTELKETENIFSNFDESKILPLKPFAKPKSAEQKARNRESAKKRRCELKKEYMELVKDRQDYWRLIHLLQQYKSTLPQDIQRFVAQYKEEKE
jgi:uncharacterized membrane protein